MFRGFFGDVFIVKVVKEVNCGKYWVVVIEVKGYGYFCGNFIFILEENDVIGRGFFL